MEHLSVEERIAVMVSKLPILDQEQIPMEDACPICLVSFSSIVDGSSSSTATASPNENEGSEVGDGREGERVGEWDVVVEGVTKLEGCGHVFCRFDLIEWIRGRHGTCPTCRNPFLDITPTTDSDGESSDGDYIPDEEEEEEEEEEDGFLDIDAFTDIEDFDMDVEWGDMDGDTDAEYFGSEDDVFDGDVNLGLSDGDGSASLSEGDVVTSSGDEDPSLMDGATVYSASGELLPGQNDASRDGGRKQ